MVSEADIAVLIPHYNSPEALGESIKSIQESIPIDVIVVDDGSTHKTISEEETDKCAGKNVNLHYIYLDANKGIEEALNTGLKYILTKSYTFIARLDCGDRCVINRMAIQKKALLADETLGMVGAYVKYVDLEGNFLYDFKPPTSFKGILNKMHVNSMFVHPAVMFKTEVVRTIGLYPTTYPAAEDFAYFFKIIKHYKAITIPEYLIHYEINPGGISLSRRQEQLQTRLKILKEEFYWGFYPVYGLIRNYVIANLPYRFIYNLKKFLR